MPSENPTNGSDHWSPSLTEEETEASAHAWLCSYSRPWRLGSDGVGVNCNIWNPCS